MVADTISHGQKSDWRGHQDGAVWLATGDAFGKPRGCSIWEVRTRLDGRIARTLFVTEGGVMILLHAFIKKQQKIPKPELNLAQERLKQLRRQK
ncbi:type II toxin-antitoxin system RelE/ParE family toxin [Sulfuriferula plumbiphila]|uniref:type II toxin-antitoxin system RelE/ParE family toxin n=1 Tax=Sulfuriferula plumbiphila TaxID=171865 RepID=UPI001CB99328|nr:type II toxin-antitoxin system RelE/ParE family toxin [Sulfuriferula plumbiphila]